jgi:hypothetical protein
VLRVSRRHAAFSAYAAKNSLAESSAVFLL